MRNIPMFTTENGIASLVLEEIPYKKEAYIRIQSAAVPAQLLNDCVEFCHAAGAEYIYATGHDSLSKYPFHTAIWRMSCARSKLPDTDAIIVPVQKNTLDQWRNIYNERMAGVPNAATLTRNAERDLLESGSGFFIYREKALLGIGKSSGSVIDAIATVVPGTGKDILLALCQSLSAETICVEVASENSRAVNLYLRLGFEIEQEISRWYRVK